MRARDPIADFSNIHALAEMQARAADDFRFVAREHAKAVVEAEVEFAAAFSEPCDLLVERGGFDGRPGNPWAQVRQAAVDGELERHGVARLPAAYDQPLGDDAVGRSPGL